MAHARSSQVVCVCGFCAVVTCYEFGRQNDGESMNQSINRMDKRSIVWYHSINLSSPQPFGTSLLTSHEDCMISIHQSTFISTTFRNSPSYLSSHHDQPRPPTFSYSLHLHHLYPYPYSSASKPGYS